MRNRLVATLFLVFFLLAGRAALADELTAQKSSDIKQLMEITDAADIGNQFAAMVSKPFFEALREVRPDIPERAFLVIESELLTLLSEDMSASGGILDQLIPIYHKHFTHQDIRELLAFYQTPTGKKAVQVLPKVIDESMLAAQSWVESLLPEIEKRVKAALKREGIVPAEE
jgi:hypothetical protein